MASHNNNNNNNNDDDDDDNNTLFVLINVNINIMNRRYQRLSLSRAFPFLNQSNSNQFNLTQHKSNQTLVFEERGKYFFTIQKVGRGVGGEGGGVKQPLLLRGPFVIFRL